MNLITMKYSDDYEPPAPIARIKLRNAQTLAVVSDVPMLLDTGSDITLLPKTFCEQIGVEISETDYLELVASNEDVLTAFYARIEFVFNRTLFRGKYLVYDQGEGIIGRDILNRFRILFDGVNLEWNVQK